MKKIVFTFFLLLLFSNLYCGPIQIKANGLSSAHAPRNPESIPITASINNNVLSIMVGKNVGIAHMLLRIPMVFTSTERMSSQHQIMPHSLLMMPAITEWTSH